MSRANFFAQNVNREFTKTERSKMSQISNADIDRIIRAAIREIEKKTSAERAGEKGVNHESPRQE